MMANGENPEKGRVTGGKRRPQLRDAIAEWKRLRAQIEKLRQGPAGEVQNAAELARLRAARKRRVNEINALVSGGAKPRRLATFAVNQGFRAELLTTKPVKQTPQGPPNPNKPGDPHGGGTGGTAGGGKGGGTGGGGTAAKGGGGKKGGGGRPGVEGDLLPGQRGKHYRLVRHGGRQYVVYRVRVPGTKRFVQVAWRVRNPDKHGFSKGAGRQITKKQFQNLQVWGESSEIVRRRGGNKHPFRKAVRDLTEMYGTDTTFLKNKEVMGVLLMGHLEKMSPEEIMQRLKQTNWYRNRTDAQRAWALDKSPKQRERELANTTKELTNAARELYGQVNFRDHLDDKRIENLSRRIASGRLGDPGQAFNNVVADLRREAEKVEGSTAWVNKQQEEISERDFMNRPDEMYEQIRNQMLRDVGPFARLDGKTLRTWAEDLAFGRKSGREWEVFLRNQKRAHLPFLDPNTAWQDFASTYKGELERIIGTTTNWDDQFLSSLAARDKEGKAISDQAMTLFDYAQFVRDNDPRFWQAPQTEERGRQFTQGVLGMLTGSAG